MACAVTAASVLGLIATSSAEPAVSSVHREGWQRASGDITPRHYDFTQVSETPEGYSTWLVRFGLDVTGGLVGETEDVEYQILEPDGSGELNSASTFDGSLDGHEGGFVYEAQGIQNPDGTFNETYRIVSGSGYGELEGIDGIGRIVGSRDHCEPEDTPETCPMLVSYELRYHLAITR